MFSKGHNGNSVGLYNGLQPLLLEGSIERERGIEIERNLGIPEVTSDQARSSFFLPCNFIFYLKFSPL